MMISAPETNAAAKSALGVKGWVSVFLLVNWAGFHSGSLPPKITNIKHQPLQVQKYL